MTVAYIAWMRGRCVSVDGYNLHDPEQMRELLLEVLAENHRLRKTLNGAHLFTEDLLMEIRELEAKVNERF